MSSDSSSNSNVEAGWGPSKSLTPPTIASVVAHQRTAQRYGLFSTTTTDSDDKDGRPLLADMPGRLSAYALEHSWRPSDALRALQTKTEQMDRAVMAGAPDEANLLCLLCEMLQAQRVVEIGVFRGLTTLALAECLQGMDKGISGTTTRRIYGLDVSADYAVVGQEAWKTAGVDHLIDFRVGDAKATLAALLEELGPNSVDMVFIDADKTSYDNYYETSLQLVRPGGLIVVDNTLWGGSVAVPSHILKEATASDDPELVARAKDALAIHTLNAKIAADERVSRVSFLTIADGVTLCRKK